MVFVRMNWCGKTGVHDEPFFAYGSLVQSKRVRATETWCVGVSSVLLPQRNVRSASIDSSYATAVPGAPEQGAVAENAKRSREYRTSSQPACVGDDPPVVRASNPGNESVGLVAFPSSRLTNA